MHNLILHNFPHKLNPKRFTIAFQWIIAGGIEIKSLIHANNLHSWFVGLLHMELYEASEDDDG